MHNIDSLILDTYSHVSTSTNVSLVFVHSLMESIATNPHASCCIVGFLPCVTTLEHSLGTQWGLLGPFNLP